MGFFVFLFAIQLALLICSGDAVACREHQNQQAFPCLDVDCYNRVTSGSRHLAVERTNANNRISNRPHLTVAATHQLPWATTRPRPVVRLGPSKRSS